MSQVKNYDSLLFLPGIAATGKLKIGTERRIKTSSSYLKIPYTTHTLNSLPAVHHLVMLSIQIPQDDILERQEKKEGEGRRDVAIPNNAETLCSLQL